MMRRRSHANQSSACAVLIGACLTLSPVDATPPTEYELIDLGTLGGNPEITDCWPLMVFTPYWDFAAAYGVNNAGQVVGSVAGPECGDSIAFIWQDGELQAMDLLHPNWSACAALDINDAGQIIGSAWDELPILPGIPWQTATRWDAATGEATSLGYLTSVEGPPPLDQNPRSDGWGINGPGIAVGTSVNELGLARGFSVDVTVPEAGMVELIGLDANLNAIVHEVNDAGLAVGRSEVGFTADPRATAWDLAEGGIAIDLGNLPDGVGSVAWDVNEQGVVVGFALADLEQNHDMHPVMWTADGIVDLFNDVQQVNSPLEGTIFSADAQAINNHGDIVGTFNTDNGFECDTPPECASVLYGNAYLWSDGTAIALDDLIPPDSNFATLNNARDINDDGWIVGWGYTQDSFLHAFLLRPAGPDADLDGDNIVGVSDLLILLAAWGPCDDPSDCPADLTGDGIVGVADLLELLAAWG